MSSAKAHPAVLRVLRLLTVLVALPSATPLLSCPKETVTYPPFTLWQLKGRLLPMEGDELLPGTRVDFVIHQKGTDRPERWNVPVSGDGTFILGLPEGTYEYRIQVEGFLFTLVGDVTISSEADHDATMELKPPWC